jgi:signal transduction histidine kinase/CheY-like chemotaxis protein
MAQSCELQLMTQDGSHIWVSLSANVARPNTGGTTLRVMLKDITERVRLDEKLLEKNLELERTRQVADKANQAKSEFLASMSHELRSPLNAILGFAQLIAAGSPPPTAAQKSSIDHILHGGWYLLGLINEILDLAGIESGQLALSMGTESLTEVMRDCQSMIEPLARAAEIQVKFPSFDQACFVHADGRRLKQVLVNLLTNAIKYNRSKGEVTVSLSLRAQGRVRISIQDGGRGLTPEQLQQLFQPFNRLGQESGTQEGSGIGLVVCKRLVELMGGSIGAQSTPGVGSVFWFELAQSGQPGAAAVAMQALTEPTLVAPGVAPATPVAVIHTVLYVEDNAANVALVQQLVARRPDLQLISAQDALQGIAMVRLHQPRLILMDINLPGISGLQALYLLREDPTTRHIPVLAISANAMPKEIESALAAGFFAYLTKPIRVDQFMQVLDQGLALAAKTA